MTVSLSVFLNAFHDRIIAGGIAKGLMKEYGLRETENFETNLNSFMRYIGMLYSIIWINIITLLIFIRCPIRASDIVGVNVGSGTKLRWLEMDLNLI